MSHRYRYQRYRGGPDPLAPPVDVRAALDAIGDDVMAGRSPRRALSEYLRRGSRDQIGLDELRRRVNEHRNRLLQKNDLASSLQKIREILDDAVLAERKQLARDLDDDARFDEMRLANLSESTAQAVLELQDYQWRSDQAREQFEQVQQMLGREMADQQFAGMKEWLQGATDEDKAALVAMMRDLNALLAQHNQGRDTRAMFAAFMAQHGVFFPENPRNTDELIELLAGRAATAAAMLNSMTQQQRDELMALSEQALGSDELSNLLGQMGDALSQARPDLDWSGQPGDGPGDFGQFAAMSELAELDSLEQQLGQQYQGASLDDIDLDALARQLDPEAAVDARTLADIEKALADQFFSRDSEGHLRLSPKALRQLGGSIMRDIGQQLAAKGGDRDSRGVGTSGEPTGATREWEYGNVAAWDVTRSVTNAVRRTVAQGADPSKGVDLDMRDVEVVDTEARTKAAVALLVDTSFSMVVNDRWIPMKRTAIALNHLISTRFRNDDLEIITFGLMAQTCDIGEVAGLPEARTQGTNLHHALLLAHRHLRRHPNSAPVVLVVTDGEPTAHTEPDGTPFFFYPPLPYTLGLTVAQLDSLRRMGASVTFFQLGDDPGLVRFIDQVARRIGGRVVTPDPDGLGAAVVGDYLRRRR